MIDFSQIPKEEDKDKKSPQEGKSEDSISFSSFPPQKTPSEEGISFSKKEVLAQASFSEKELLKAKEPYQQALAIAEKVIRGSFTSSELEEAKKIVEVFIDFTKKGEQELLSFVFSPYTPSVHYLSLSLVNVCILSLEVGWWLGLEKESLFKLGLASLLHDIGMGYFLELVDKPRKITISEYQAIKTHPEKGKSILKKNIQDIDEEVLLAIEEEHERLDGSGYPRGLKESEIIELAEIVGFIDVYEALTHKRPYRQALPPTGAIKVILSKKKSFSYKVGRAFLERIGLYPKGTLVELNTKEVGYVSKHNPKTPTSPWVRVLFDSQGEKLSKIKEIDLSKSPGVYIVKSKI
ncbi:MAG TPA: HD domain-containing protein [Candidatus Omnitrophica bacterium]|nr:HD domain-containing protein [Candidatus Omnitrophota bacterium]